MSRVQRADQRTERNQLRHAAVDLREGEGGQLVLAGRHEPGLRKNAAHHLRASCQHEPIRSALALRDPAATDVHDALQPAVVENRDPIGESRQLVQVVRRNEDDPIVAPQVVHEVAEALGPHRVEPVRGLVEHEHQFIVQQGLRETESLEVSLGELAHPLRAVLLEAELRDAARHARVQRTGGYTGQQGVPLQRLPHSPRRRDVHQLREVPDAMPLHEASRCEAMDADRARSGPEETEEERDERTLARPIRSGEAEYLAGSDLERQIVQGDELTPGPAAVPLADAIELDQRGAIGWAPLGDMPGGIVPTGTVPGAGAHAVHAPAPARWIQRTPSSRRPRRTSEQPR